MPNTTSIHDSPAGAVVTDAPAHSGVMLAGYVLQQRLGEGGYGTVWKAIGPGGLPKAVKVLRGRFDGQSAETELRALNRMRELRHPFVLSVERIEVIDQQLVIVTELAECSLEDRYESLREGGKRGVPQSELLVYMNDAAEALDFMCDAHGLQHLDVKPGNLLIQGGHLKVADFGLLRDVRQTQQSVIAGFTPMYAPPELFDGKPGRFSDQYSLAIVYQTMLTGVPPFNGRTAAQLASQHLRSQPDLSPLSPSERPAVARALSKNPTARFRTCREFVEALSRNKPSTSAARVPLAPKADRTETATIAAPASSRPAVASQPVPPQPLPGLKLRPQIVVALGGFATRVAVDYRRALASLLPHGGADTGDVADLDALPVLALDTDTRSVAAARRSPTTDGLADREVLSLPLRDSKDYRNQSDRLLEWLGRRWLFNIPRSRQVDGMRPLGRLAFVDHRDAVHRRLTDMIRYACSAEALAAAGRRVGQAFDGRPEIVVVSSTHGGTGSGMLHDVAYLARQILEELSIQGTVVGLMLHGTTENVRSQQVQIAGTISCLQEWSHYAHCGYRAGFRSRKTEIERPPFDHAYFVSLGDDLTDESLADGAGQIADYLARAAVTPVRSFLDLVRQSEAGSASDDEPTEAIGGTTLRTFHLQSSGAVDGQSSEAAENLARLLVRRWRHGSLPAAASPQLTAEWGARLQKELRLEFDPLLNMATTVLCGDVGRAFQAFVTRRIEQFGSQPLSPEEFERQLQVDFQATSKDAPPNQPGVMIKAVAGQSRTWAKHCCEHLGTRLFALVGEAFGVAQADDVVAELLRRLEAARSQLDQAAASGALAVDPSATPQHAGENPDRRNLIFTVYRQWFAAGLIGCLIEATKEIARAATAFRSELACAASRTNAVDASMNAGEAKPFPTVLDAEALSELQDFAQWIAKDGRLSLRRLSQSTEEGVAAWPDQLIRAASQFLSTRMPAVNVSGGDSSSDPLRPKVWNLGGRHHVLSLSAGPGSPDLRQSLEGRFGPSVTTARDDNSFPCVLVEAERLDFDMLLTRLGAADSKLLEIAAQLRTRRDVEWTIAATNASDSITP